MAVEVDLLNANSVNNINTNFTRVKTALQDAVSRQGDLPNELNADFDLNGNDVLNGGVGNFENILIDGVPVNEVVGADGWSPILAVANDGSRRVFRVVDWVGGEGVKPTELGYVGSTGLVSNIALGVDVRGATGPAGPGVGDMLASVYDPQSIADDAFARANHTGTQLLSTISDAGTAAGVDTGTGAGDVPILDGSGKLDPSVIPAGVSGDVIEVVDRTTLKAVDTSLYTLAYLTETGREGLFVWRSGDYSAQITADTQEGLFVKADSIAADDGAWVRGGDWETAGVNIAWFGGIPDASTSTGIGTDNLPILNIALAVAKPHTPVHMGPGNWYVSGAINLPMYKGIRGVGHTTNAVNANNLSTNRGTILVTNMAAGSLDGNGRPQTEFIRLNKGSFVEKFGAIWVGHPDPNTVGWEPVDTPWFIRCGRFTDTSFTGTRATGVRLNDIRGYAFTHGYEFQRGADAESYLNFLGGHFFKVGFSADGIHDIFRITGGVHLWRHWSAAAPVSEYMLKNLRAYEFGRIDGLQVNGGLFSIGAYEGCVFIGSRSPDFATQFAAAFDIDHLYCDGSGYGLTVESGHNGVPLTGRIGFLSVSRPSAFVPSSAAEDYAVRIIGFTEIDIKHAWLTGSGYHRKGGHIKITGTRPSQLRIGACQYSAWDDGVAGVPAFDISGNTHAQSLLYFGERPLHDGIITAPAASKYNGLNIDVDEWRPYSATVSALAGSTGSGSATTAQYKRRNETCEIDATVNVATLGDWSLALTLTLPFKAKRICSSAYGGNRSTGHIVRGTAQTSVARMDIQRDAAAFPATGNNQNIDVRASYELTL